MAIDAIRDARPEDAAGLEALCRAAFPEDDLVPLLRALAAEPGVLSLVAEAGGRIVGHVVLTPCRAGGDGPKVALLGPLAVAPERQKQGIGSALVREGLARMAGAGAARVLVLGDPAYYARFGFAEETEIATPVDIPDDWAAAWRSVRLSPAATVPGVRLAVPAPWRDPALWGP